MPCQSPRVLKLGSESQVPSGIPESHEQESLVGWITQAEHNALTGQTGAMHVSSNAWFWILYKG